MPLFRTASAVSVGDLYALIRDKREVTRAEVGKLTGLSRTAVSARVRELTGRNLVFEREQAVSTGGRPPALLSFNAGAGIVLAAAVGRSRTHLAVCNLAGEYWSSPISTSMSGQDPMSSCRLW